MTSYDSMEFKSFVDGIVREGDGGEEQKTHVESGQLPYIGVGLPLFADVVPVESKEERAGIRDEDSDQLYRYRFTPLR